MRLTYTWQPTEEPTEPRFWNFREVIGFQRIPGELAALVVTSILICIVTLVWGPLRLLLVLQNLCPSKRSAGQTRLCVAAPAVLG